MKQIFTRNKTNSFNTNLSLNLMNYATDFNKICANRRMIYTVYDDSCKTEDIKHL